MLSEVNGVLVAAHELKGPLALLRQLAFSLEYADSDRERLEIQREMIDVSDRALKQINDLTSIARIESGRVNLESVAVRSVCNDVTSELGKLFRADRKNLEIDYRNHARLVVGNRDLIHSIVYNFCLNALHYSDVETASRLTVRDHQKNVRLEVRDFGPALPTDVWKALRSGWLEQPTSIAMRPGSSGLGLYIASKFSKAMHAPVGAVRHRDGTSFYVELPAAKQESLFV
ncbi:HAMP domain-containing histidine kinase [Candidatus Saccharibacteria bacterium]|nr:HAMP domain-containing histidine kinase [Candidatus Saccharibacteria bacterium]